MRAQVLDMASGGELQAGSGRLWTIEVTASFVYSLFSESPKERAAICARMMRAGTLTEKEAVMLESYLTDMRGEYADGE